MMDDFSAWLHALAIVTLVIGGVSALVIAIDEARRPQHMWIMYLVWPLTALFWLRFYWRHGRSHHGTGEHDEPPVPIAVPKGASHCGAGCTLGDIIAQRAAFATPGIAVALGWQSPFAERTFAV